MLKSNLYGLTNPQKSIWVTEKFYNNCSINNICGTAIIKEKVDFEKLSEAIKIVCKKYDNFMLEIKIVDGNIKQMLSKKQEIEPEFINIESQEELEKEREKIVRTTFNLENSKLFKFYIFKFKNGEGAFMLNIHHLISDAWTLALICNEIIKTYSNLKQHKKIETEPIYSYIDYINSEIEYQKSERFEKDKLYWEEKFKTIPEVASIPGSIKKDMDSNNPNGARKQYALEKSYVAKIKEYCKENKISLYNFFMAIYAIYIGEISNLNEFVIGTPILNRTNFKEKNTPGMFINTAPFKINLDEDLKFKEFVKNIAIDSIRMLKHQKYSYQLLLENLRQKNNNIPNLYNILLSYQITNAMQTEENINYKTEWTFNGYCADDIDIHIYDINDTGNLNIAYDYKTSIYADLDIENVHKRILNIIEQILKKEDINVKDIEIVTPEEKYFIINELNKTELEYDEKVPIIKYFEEQAQLTPNNIAITFENKEMTYKELNEKANSLAYVLRENGVKNNSIVGILEDRSFEVMIAILAVLKSGGSYIPIATDYPSERIEYMLEDSNAEILLTEKENYVKTDKKIISIKLGNEFYNEHKNNIENISKPDDLSYLIYTSGSTGTPKGVMLKQQNLTNFYNSMKEKIEYLNDGKNHKILSITTISFDIFAFESLISLTRGLTVYLTNNNEQKISFELERIIKDNQIEIIQTTPSVMKLHLENFKDKNNLKSLKYVVLAGEPLPKMLVEDLKNIIPDITIYNGYGPSETTIFSSVANVTKQEVITIGFPIHNTQIYILNKNKKILPFGTIGELYISGDGVGKGYMNKEKQTKQSFIPNPFIPGQIMYKVGDLGAYNNKMEIICYGRIDNQIKIRGLRIELPEIEKQIQSVYNISDCVVVKKEIKGKDALCAYYIQNGPVNKVLLKNVLHSKLPDYMIPQYFVKLENFPHTPNGKIDKKSLPLPELETKKVKIVKPRNEFEALLVQIIKQKLGVTDVSIDTNIFDLGADSLSVIGIITELFSYNYNIKVADIYENPTIRSLSENVLKMNASKKIKNISKHSELLTINEKVHLLTKNVDCTNINNKYTILLTGATGFFGCHLLIEMLKNENSIKKIYCIVRSKKNNYAKDRLIRKIHFYFNDQYDDLVDKYVEVVEGEIINKHFQVNTEKYKELIKETDIVIHSAANVKHYGNYHNSEEANIDATRNVIDFCKEAKAHLHYISTMTISGNYLSKQDKNDNLVFDENTFYIGQNFEDNVYSKSKLIAETLVLNYMSSNTKATVYRLGDLTGRYSDGHFQKNINDNATYLRLKSILEIGAIPENLRNIKLEFSPVDYVSKAVRMIIWSNKCENRIFNIYNPNLLPFLKLKEFLRKQNYTIKEISKEEFSQLIKEISSEQKNQKKLIGIINDFTDNDDLIYNYTIKQSNTITCEYLKKLGFDWITIDEEYICKLLTYMKHVNFIK